MGKTIRPYVWVASIPKALLVAYVGLCLLLLGLLLALNSLGQDLERDVGLRILFNMRGALAPPKQVVVVAIDDRTSQAIALPASIERYQLCETLFVGGSASETRPLPPAGRLTDWPRCVHARLLDALRHLGAELIVFDLTFRSRDPYEVGGHDVRHLQDQQLAAAMRRAGNVFLATKVYSHRDDQVAAQASRADLSEVLLRESVAVGPLHMLDTHAPYGRLALYSDADVPRPSLLVVAMGYMLRASFDDIIAQAAPAMQAAFVTPLDGMPGEWEATTMQLRQALRKGGGGGVSSSAWVAPSKAALSAAARRWVALLSAHDPAYQMNFYGPPGTVPRVRYEDVLAPQVSQSLRDRLQGRAVFVGYAEVNRPEQTDHYESYFTAGEDVHYSGVELAATAFGNLLDGSGLRPIPNAYLFAVILLFAFGPLAIVVYYPRPLGYGAALGVGVLYLGLAWLLFKDYNLWLPIVVPEAIMLPLALVIALSWQTMRLSRRRSELEGFLGRLLPREVVERIRENTRRLGLPGDSAMGACVATDAERFSSIAEALPTESLVRLMDRYFTELTLAVARHDGVVSNLAGDEMIAVWAHDNETWCCKQACEAALAMLDGIEKFNSRYPKSPLPTRIGIHWGAMSFGSLGGHAPLGAFGDTVNTASRLQTLNKVLRTQVLISMPAMKASTDYLARDVGLFALRGKSIPTQVFELIGHAQVADAAQRRLCAEFAVALSACKEGRVQEGLQLFRALAASFPDDGPTLFYVQYIAEHPGWIGGAIPID